MKHSANARFAITNWDEKPYSEGQELPRLTRASVTKPFTGDLEGEGHVEDLMMYRTEGCGGQSGRPSKENVIPSKARDFLEGSRNPWRRSLALLGMSASLVQRAAISPGHRAWSPADPLQVRWSTANRPS